MRTVDDMTQEEFDEILMIIMDDTPAYFLVDIPGVYDLVSKYYKNEIIERWERIYGND